MPGPGGRGAERNRAAAGSGARFWGETRMANMPGTQLAIAKKQSPGGVGEVITFAWSGLGAA
jgi:hypothetical protein